MNPIMELPEMTQAETAERTALYYREGSSDKVYQCAIERAGHRFVVNFAYGRRGTTLNTGTKTNVPVDYSTARRVYDKLIREKMAKGYTPGAEGTPYQFSDDESRATGILPQLLNPIEEEDLEKYLNNPDYCMQQKFDGKRVMIRKTGDQVTGINRKGLVIGLPRILIEGVQRISRDFLMDGECVGDEFYAFDLLTLETEDLRSLGYFQRWRRLGRLLDTYRPPHIHWVDTTVDLARKKEVLQALRQSKAEGVVFKKCDAPYIPGRPASGGPQLKFKFYATLSAVVSNLNDKRSVELQLFSSKEGWVNAGNVTLPTNQAIPRIGAVVEVKYLYAFKESGCLFQPVYLGERSDINPIECTVNQLKFKPQEEEES